MRKTHLLMVDLQASIMGDIGRGPRPYLPYGFHMPDSRAQLAFAGEPVDPLTGCYHLGNGKRAYKPLLMRFQSPDTISPFGAGGLNAYAYCLGDPVNHKDPTGHKAEDYVLPVLSIFTNLAALFVSGLRFRSFYKRSVASRALGTVDPATTVTRATAKDWTMSAISAGAAVAGLTLGVARTVEPGEDWQTWALAALTTIALGTTIYEAWGMAQEKPWRVPITPLALSTPPTGGGMPQTSSTSAVGSGIRQGI